MEEKKHLLVKIGIALLLLLTAGTVYAAVHARVAVKNVITVGNIDVELHQQDKKGKEVGSKTVEVSRGYQVDRIVFAENTGNQPAFVRISVNCSFVDSETGEELPQDKMRIIFNEDARWIYRDGWYYYAEALEPGEKTVPVLSGVQFDASLDETNQNDVLNLNIIMHGLQAKNNAEDVLDAEGWPEEE